MSVAKVRRLGLAVAGALTAVVTACSGSSGVVDTAEVSGVDGVLVDGEGRTLYVAEEESGGEVRCTGGCLELWEPLTVAEGAELSSDGELSAKLATTDRDGELQVTFDGYPLYRFAEDGSSGEMKGNAVTDEFGGTSFTWHAMTASGPAPESTQDDTDGDSGGGYGY